jgi:hypothetical protein
MMSQYEFGYDAPPALMLYYSNPPDMKKEREVESDYVMRAGGKAALNNFIEQMNLYSKDADFAKFYSSNSKFYREIVEETAEKIKNYDIIGDLEGYYGIKQHSYSLILAPLFLNGGYGPRIERNDGSYDIYGIIGPNGVKDGVPQFNEENIIHLGWHEFGHSFINPLTRKNINEINKYSKLFDPIRNIMTSQAYGEWEICVNEHINRAVVARINYIKFGEETYNLILNNERANGFFYIDAICEKLELYENSRDKYKTFEDFYPELIKVFKELSESKLDKNFYKLKYAGPINMIYSMNNPIVFIVPTNEKDKSVRIEIADYVKKVKSSFDVFKNAEVITDAEALNKDLGGSNIIAYGTIEGNLWLAKYEDKFPFKISEDKITLGRDYVSKNLRLITGLPNPQNSENALIIYTAQKPEDIAGINSVFHGPSDFMVSEGTEEIVSGNYIKQGAYWRVK